MHVRLCEVVCAQGVATDVFIHCWDGAFEAELNKMYQPTGMEYQPPRSFHSHPWIDKHMSMFTSIQRVVRLKVVTRNPSQSSL